MAMYVKTDKTVSLWIWHYLNTEGKQKLNTQMVWHAIVHTVLGKVITTHRDEEGCVTGLKTILLGKGIHAKFLLLHMWTVWPLYYITIISVYLIYSLLNCTIITSLFVQKENKFQQKSKAVHRHIHINYTGTDSAKLKKCILQYFYKSRTSHVTMLYAGTVSKPPSIIQEKLA